jgi:hypothetical protein
MEATLNATIVLINENSEAQEEFIHRGGILFLRDSLKDYNITIKVGFYCFYSNINFFMCIMNKSEKKTSF